MESRDRQRAAERRGVPERGTRGKTGSPDRAAPSGEAAPLPSVKAGAYPAPILPWPGFAVVLAALFCLDPRRLFPAVGCGVLVHEAGHLLALWLCGAGPVRLELSGAGAVLHTKVLSWPRQLVCDLAGPTAGLAFALAVEDRWPLGGAVSQLLSCWNLLPVLPLDGGQAVQAMLLGLAPESWLMWYERLQWPLAMACVPAALYIALFRGGGLVPLLLAAALISHRAR